MPDPSSTSFTSVLSSKKSVPVFGLLLLVLAGLALFEVRPDAPADWMLFFGRFHPLVVHLPIGFLLLGVLFAVASMRDEYKALGAAVPLTLWLSTLSALVACVVGFLLSTSGDYDPDALALHQWFGLGIAASSWLAYTLHAMGGAMLKNWLRPAYQITLAASMVFLALGGHFGGTLTHGSTYLTQYMPEPLRTIAGLPPREKSVDIVLTNIDEAVVFTDIIQPVLNGRCASCHNPSKNKGSLRLDTIEGIERGGESGAVVEAGFSGTSELYRRLILPADDEYRMPPDGRRPLTDAQIALIGWWIDEGAHFDAPVASLEVPDEIQTILTNLAEGGSTEPRPTGIFALDVPPADQAAMEALQALGVSALPLAEEVPFLQVDFLNAPDSLLSEQLAALQPLAQHITWLNLANKPLSDDDANVLATLPHLTRLHLEKTNITDATLQQLTNATYLEYLNVYGTDVSDAGLTHLETLDNLASIYAWQTQVTKEGAASLQAVLPTVQVNLGIEAFNPASTAETD